MSFKNNVIVSFKKAKQEHDSLKNNSSEWIHYLNAKQAEQDYRIRKLEEKLEKLVKLARD